MITFGTAGSIKESDPNDVGMSKCEFGLNPNDPRRLFHLEDPMSNMSELIADIFIIKFKNTWRGI